MSIDTVVIGAGWSGLKAATELHEAGREVVVLEKSRGPGGRSASRRIDGHRFDHGAQYFTARSAAFARRLQQWRDEDLVQPWKPRLAVIGDRSGHHDPEETARFVAMPGMNGVCRNLADPLDCRFGVRVASLAHDGKWRIGLDDGESVEARRLLITAPPAQAAELLGTADPFHDRLASVEFRPCIAAMLSFETALDPGFDAAFVNDSGPLAWIARNSSKPGRTGNDWVLHATGEWSEAHLEDSFDDMAQRLANAFADVVGEALPASAIRSAHRWRYSQAADPIDEGALVDSDRRLAIAGDWLSGSRIEGAWSSGRKAGRWLAGS
ncbi:MAG: NAD(P)/FAD-dependent oxidoreductase [Candidatus Wenzhouxiangella sp. M2_3B_020]